MTVSEETDRREAALREMFELGVLTSDELRAELAAVPDRDKSLEVTFRLLPATSG